MRNTLLSFVALLAVVTLTVTVQVVGQGIPTHEISVCYEYCIETDCDVETNQGVYCDCSVHSTHASCSGKTGSQYMGTVATRDHTAHAYGNGATNKALNELDGDCGDKYFRATNCSWDLVYKFCECDNDEAGEWVKVNNSRLPRYECRTCDDEDEAPYEPPY